MPKQVKVTWDNINAFRLAELFVATAKDSANRVGHKQGGTQGNPNGYIPYDTGALQDSIRITASGVNEAQVRIGNEDVDYAVFLEFMELQASGKPNLHRGWVENFIIYPYENKLRKQLKADIGVNIERGQDD